MVKPPHSTILLVLVFLALMLALPSAHLYAGPIDKPNDSPTSSICNAQQTDIEGLNQSESPRLMAQAEAQAAEEHYCVKHCRHHYEKRLKECSEPDHPHHKRCKKWAREREKECLEKCYHEYPK